MRWLVWKWHFSKGNSILQLDVSLNGIGTWKGRNIIACLTVVYGEWDRLLVWPCKLQADIILRDQPDNLDDVRRPLLDVNWWIGWFVCFFLVIGKGHFQNNYGEAKTRATWTKPVHFHSAQNAEHTKLYSWRCHFFWSPCTSTIE